MAPLYQYGVSSGKIASALSLVAWSSLAGGGCAGCGGPQGDPGKSATRLELAKDFLLNKGDLEAAEEEANRALAFQPGNEEAENVLGLVYFRRAINDFLLVEVEGCMTGVDAESIRTDLDEHLTTAGRHFQKAAALAPGFGDAWANLGLVAMQLESYDAAIEHLSTALTLPNRLLDIGNVRAHLGWAYFHRHDYVRAAKELLQSRQFRPGSCLANYRLGRVYFAREEWEKATEKFQEVSADPSCYLTRQEADLYLMKSLYELHGAGASEAIEQARAACIAQYPQSCIAAECRALGRDRGMDAAPSTSPDPASAGD